MILQKIRNAPKVALATGLAACLLTPTTLLAGNGLIDAEIAAKVEVKANADAAAEQREHGRPVLAQIRMKTEKRVSAKTKDTPHIEMEDPATGASLKLAFTKVEDEALRLDGDYATSILEDGGYGLVTKGKVMAFAPFSENLYIGRSRFKDVNSQAEVEVDTWYSFAEGELEPIVDVIHSIDDEVRLSYSTHASTNLSAF